MCARAEGDTRHSAVILKGLARYQGICSEANGVGMPLVAEHLLDARDTIVRDTTNRASGLPTTPRFGRSSLGGCPSLISRIRTGGYGSQYSSASLDSGYDSGHVSGYGYDSGYDSSAGYDGNMMATQYGSGYDSGMIEIGWC